MLNWILDLLKVYKKEFKLGFGIGFVITGSLIIYLILTGKAI
jgi:hypothetical protein|tara:strand:- start:4018 stop:4143 length:126 start_codon:yes stop_codon:yes gene_type:complete